MITLQPNQFISTTTWPLPRKNEIFLWILPIDDSNLLDFSINNLSEKEKEHLNRLPLSHTKKEYQIGHGCLRGLLSQMLNLPYDQIMFSHLTHGKPVLASVPDNSPYLYFNLSHSSDYVALAVSSTSPVGVDIEHMRPNLNVQKLADRFFHPEEIATLHSLPAHMKLQWFTRHWTMKEAFLKALGDGLSYSTSDFQIDIFDEDSAIYCIKNSQKDFSSWLIEQRSAPNGYYLSIAYQKF